MTEEEQKRTWDTLKEEAKQVQQEVAQERDPHPESIWDHVYANNENADWRKF